MYNEVLGQPIDKKINELMSEIQAIFPTKELHIRKLEDAAKELEVGAIQLDCDAFCDPAITNYIAIWIKADLPNEEFNAILAEELLHHKQAYEGFPEIIALQPKKPDIAYRDIYEIHNFGLQIVSIICDLDAHRRMLTIPINIEPLLATDLRNFQNTIKEINASADKLKALKTRYAKFTVFPKYLLWWFDLCELGFPKYVSFWNQEIRPWLTKVMPDTIGIWDYLTGFIHKNPIIDSDSAKQALDLVFDVLLDGVPTLERKKTHGKSLLQL